MNGAIVEKPLASFCVKSYNQKKYLIDALKGAFAQTYRPLEIVISDDGSTDGSWEYIQQAVEEFKKSHDDVPVIINHNSPNLGNLGNWQKCCELAHGELLIKADGDDISFPERTEEIVNAWIKGDKKAVVVCHGGVRISLNGTKLGPTWIPTSRMPLGAAMAWSRRCYDEFRKEVDGRVLDDTVYGWRSVCLGAELLIDRALIYYREGSGISSIHFKPRQPTLRGWSIMAAGDAEALRDLKDFQHKGRLSDELYFEIKQAIESQRGMSLLYVRLISSRGIGDRINAFSALRQFTRSKMSRFLQAIYILPCWIGDPLLNSYAIMKFFLRYLRRSN